MSDPRDPGRVVVVGAGVAGYSAADMLRTLGHTGTIMLVDAEPVAYDRPPLSKKLFEPGFDIATLAFASPEKLAARSIDTIFDRTVIALDPGGLSVTLKDGEVLEADTILLATGGRPRALPIPGADLDGVHVLRTFADAAAIGSRVAPGCRATVIGAGLIGAELASSLRHAGATVTLVGPVAVPLVPAVGSLVATYLHDMHTVHGIEVVLGTATRIEPRHGALQVEVDSGRRVDADVVVVGIGIVPNTELAVAAGIEVDDGILIDDRHRSSAPAVYAAGDVARRRDDGTGPHRREEHWEAAQLGGQGAAYGMLGREAPKRGAPWFWTDRHGIHLEAVGCLSGTGEIVQRGGGVHPAVFLLDDGRLVGAVAIDDSTTVRAARRLIDQCIPVSAAALADPAVSMRSLLKVAR